MVVLEPVFQAFINHSHWTPMTAAVRRLEGYFEACLEVLKAETIRQKHGMTSLRIILFWMAIHLEKEKVVGEKGLG